MYVCVCMCVVSQRFQISSRKPLGQSKSNFIWSLHGMGERTFVQLVQVTWPRWPPCPYMVKALKKSPPEPKGRWPWNLVCSIGFSSTIKFFSNDDPGVTLTYFTARWNLVPYAFVWEKVKTMEFSETIVVYDVKVGRCSELNDCVNLYEYQRSRSCIDLGPRSLRFNTFKFLRNCLADWSQISYGASMGWGKKI